MPVIQITDYSEENEMENILMIGAHYDDVELGCGGTAARFISEGKKVYKLILTDNFVRESSFNKFTAPDKSMEESKKACEILGIQEISDFTKVPNCNLTYSTELMQRIESIILKYTIDTVFMHSQNDMNHDHIEAARICMVAARHVSNLYTYRSNIYITEAHYVPRVYWDISDFYEKKKEALSSYGIEHQRSMANGMNHLFENIICQNKIWGYAIDKLYAEGFEVIKEVR
jgi:LmbE family N-acetylglucosaminyl deacetylase